MITNQQHKDAISKSMSNIKPSAEGIADIELFRSKAKELAYTIIDKAPQGRERSLAITKLEESLMWAVKAIVLSEVGER